MQECVIAPATRPRGPVPVDLSRYGHVYAPTPQATLTPGQPVPLLLDQTHVQLSRPPQAAWTDRRLCDSMAPGWFSHAIQAPTTSNGSVRPATRNPNHCGPRSDTPLQGVVRSAASSPYPTAVGTCAPVATSTGSSTLQHLTVPPASFTPVSSPLKSQFTPPKNEAERSRTDNRMVQALGRGVINGGDVRQPEMVQHEGVDIAQDQNNSHTSVMPPEGGVAGVYC